MLERAKSSVILKDTYVRYLANPIDTNVFKPSRAEDIDAFRLNYSMDTKDFLFCFSAVGGKKTTSKAHIF